MSRNLRLFIAMALPFGLVMTIVLSSLEAGIVAGIAFGAIMVLVLGATNKLAGNSSKEAAGVHHSRDLDLKLAYNEAYDVCVESLGEIKNCKVESGDRAEGKFVAKAGGSWKTWGDTITFELSETDKETTHIKVSSRPSVATTMVDYGKNFENIEKITGFLEPHTAS